MIAAAVRLGDVQRRPPARPVVEDGALRSFRVTLFQDENRPKERLLTSVGFPDYAQEQR